MDHTKVTFKKVDAGKSDLLVALLSGCGYDGFEELGDELLAYIPETDFAADDLNEVSARTQTEFEMSVVKEKNWNEVWESNFEPVVVADFCTVRAAFHQIEVSTPYDIVITPKMSFGTGHHATTQLVMKMMRDLDFSGKTVLDFGSGTGVLAILAEKLGAASVMAIDNDEWAINNAQENAVANGCGKIIIEKASVAEILPGRYDVILANINRHILLDNMEEMMQRLAPAGILVMSGLLVADGDTIINAASKVGLVVDNQLEMNGWIALKAKKS